MRRLTTTLLTAACATLLSAHSVGATTALSLDALNFNIEKCFERSIEVASAKLPDNISTVSCHKVIRNNWSSAEVRAVASYNRGVIYLYQNQLVKAKKDFTRAVKLDPSLYQADVALAKVALKSKKYTESLVLLERALAKRPEDKILADQKARLLAKIHHQASEHQQSLNTLVTTRQSIGRVE